MIMKDTGVAAGQSADLPITPISARAREWRRISTQLLCVLALLVPMAAVALWSSLPQRGDVTLPEMFVGPMLGGSALIFWILFLHLVVCGDGLQVFGFLRPRPGLDALLGIGLAAMMFAVQFTFGVTAARLFPPSPPAPQILELISGVARNPLLLALWLGPVVWIGVALFEELARVFLLRRLWLIWSGVAGRWGTILIVSAAIGLVHAYQGPAAVATIGLQSAFLGWVFLRTGRIRALILGHALYDSVQIVFAVVMIRQMNLQ
jgi:membrane protease YdiL (CAAX protease family)